MWNSDLAQVAQTYAERCIFDYNTDSVSQQSTFTSVGENLLITSSQSVNYTSFVRSWFDERDVYTYQFNRCPTACDSYTQVNNHCGTCSSYIANLINLI